ncbi:MAG: gfo/Idh/MocA family oxidoreductase [Porphyromonadaceae bacterium]|nr:MAG: gfo/Idh/MocA family oxidoreductase [Porphyromonadaceae bacterium]
MKTTSRRSAIIQFGAFIAGAGAVPHLIGNDVFQRPKFADAVIITTPDSLHYGPAMATLPLGYDMIVEKVVAQSWRECNDILHAAVKYHSIVAVCHVLRYAPYFRKLKELCSSGVFGNILSIQHLEPVESQCPYSAIKIYQQNKWYLGHLNLETSSEEEILEKLKTTRYGICVYKQDNDVVDHQICNFDFATRQTTKWNVNQADISSGHGGGDYGLVHDFVRASLKKDPSLLTSTIQASMESHLMGFMAEKSRLDGGKVMDVKILSESIY